MNSASLNEIAYNLLNTLRGGRSSNTENLSLKQVKLAIKYYRTTFIRRDFQRNYNRYRMFEQDLGLVDVSLHDTAESDSVDSYKEILRTDNIIPTPVRMKNWEGITFVGGIDRSGKPIPIVGAQRSYWNQFNKYTGNKPEAFYRDGYIYIRNTQDLDEVQFENVINIRGVFEDPEEVHRFTANNGLELYDEDSPFPIPMDMLEGITKGLINGELKLLVQSLNDDETDLSQDEQ